ncbi:MAG: DnaB-like helicase C-terminal domain-containing protein [Proteobacteria bacterium]|nr:DnaB-like helicase C-terminal domain-containing protein [Pseudomonadota bacterium]
MSERDTLRRLIDACAQTLNAAIRSGDYSTQHVREIVSAANQKIQIIADETEWRSSSAAVGLRSSVKDAFQVIHHRHERKGAAPGLPTGFVKLDELMGGFMPGSLIALASEACAGKSALAAQIAAHRAVEDKQPVCVFSMKRSATEYTLRLIAALGSVDRQHLRDGNFEEDDWPSVTKAITQLSDAKILVDATTTQSILTLRSRMRATLRMHKAKLVVIDSLELMDKPDCAADLRGIAREFDAAVLVLAQSRGAVDVYARLRDHSLEDHADAILLLDRNQTDSPESARLIVARNRNGRTGEVKLRYFPQFAWFEEARTA